jgi:hypothetical protein
LEISSPSGVAGVRGTVFGVAVDPKGKTGISTLEGAVATTAKGQTCDNKWWLLFCCFSGPRQRYLV